MIDLVQVQVEVLVHHNELIVKSPFEIKDILNGPKCRAFEYIDNLQLSLITIYLDLSLEDDGCDVRPIFVPSYSLDLVRIFNIEHFDDLTI